VVGYQRFGGLCYHHLQGEVLSKVQHTINNKFTRTYHTTTLHGVTTQKTARDLSLHRRENPKSLNDLSVRELICETTPLDTAIHILASKALFLYKTNY